MKRLVLTIAAFCMVYITGHTQAIVNHAPQGFDTLRNNIIHGKIDTIVYISKTVGVKRRALVYTPPGYAKKNRYPVH